LKPQNVNGRFRNASDLSKIFGKSIDLSAKEQMTSLLQKNVSGNEMCTCGCDMEAKQS
jgi:hypothetical protein